MDILTKNRMAVWTIAFLVLLNVVCLSMLWLREPRSLPPPTDKESADLFLKSELGLSDTQFSEYLRLRDEHFRGAQAIHREMETLRRDLMSEFIEDPPDMAVASEIMEKIGDQQTSLERHTFDHFLELKRLCGPDQTGRLLGLLKEFFRKHPGLTRQSEPSGPPR